MASADFKKKMKTRLLKVPNAKPSGASHVVLFCPFCNRDTDHGHFYVSFNMYNDEPLLFHCFKCEISGILNAETLHMLGINELELNSELRIFNKNAKVDRSASKNLKTNSFDLKVPMPTSEFEYKKKYIEERMGVSFTYEELQYLKVIFDFAGFLKINNIDKLNCSAEVGNKLQKDFIGFLTAKNEFINFRAVKDTYAKRDRYYKYSIFQSIDNTKKFFTIPNTIDLMTTSEINIIMAEGIFDIISIYANVFNRQMKNCIFVAMCSSGYANVLKYYIQLGLIGSNINVHIFSDNDRDYNFYKKTVLSQGLLELIGRFFIWYNTTPGEKDFGVPKEKITCKRLEIK